MVCQPVAEDVVRVQGSPDLLEPGQVEPLLQITAQLPQAPGPAVEVQVDLRPMKCAPVLEGEVCMPHRVLAELLPDRGRVLLVGDVHDDPDPRKDVAFSGRVRGAHGARAAGRPALLDRRRRGDALLLDDPLNFDNIVDVCHRRLIDVSAWKAILQDPLHPPALEAQDIGAIGDALALRPLPELGLCLVDPGHVLRVQWVQHEELLSQLGEVIAIEVPAVRLQLLQQVPQGLHALGLGELVLRDGSLLRHVRNYDHDGVRVRHPHVPHVAVRLQKTLVVLPELLDRGAIRPLVQGVLRDALERHVGDDAQGPQADAGPPEEVGGGPGLAELQRPPPWRHEGHPGDHLVHRGDARPGAVRAGLRPPRDLLLRDRAEVLQREVVLLQLLQDLRHPRARLHCDGLLLLVNMQHLVHLAHGKHSPGVEGQPVGRQARADGPQLAPGAGGPADQLLQVLP
mmetsp:Transcript_60087/g.183549  ORF Transcript_60087/g.183549 Transcript_60087/m.183549 type:complete len:455 (-) Transcript_60087:94-1458(-)